MQTGCPFGVPATAWVSGYQDAGVSLYTVLEAIDKGELTAPDSVDTARAVLDRCEALAERYMMPVPVLTPDQLAGVILAEVTAGREVDPVALAYEHGPQAEAHNGAIPAVQAMLERARWQLESAIRSASLQMVANDLRPRFEAILRDVAALGEVMTDPVRVLDSGDGHVDRYRELVELERRMQRVKQLHAELVGPVEATAWRVFRDTRLPPSRSLANPRSGYVVARDVGLLSLDPLVAIGNLDWSVEVTPAGPGEAVPRLVWLADPSSQAWLPTASELRAHVKGFLAEQKAEAQRSLVVPGKV
jgi:hypothetical protein